MPGRRVLITGANKGLGHETARRLLLQGEDVWLGARDPELGKAAAQRVGGHFVQLDVTSESSVRAAVQTLAAAGGLDVLVNNAGIAGSRSPVAETRTSEVEAVYATNVFGAIRVLQAFTAQLDASPAPVVVNVSSGLGSFGRATDRDSPFAGFVSLAYPSSKSALNMLTIHWAKAHPRWRVNAADPGYTATDLNEHRGNQTVEEGANAIVMLASVPPDGPTGTCRDRFGVVPW